MPKVKKHTSAMFLDKQLFQAGITREENWIIAHKVCIVFENDDFYEQLRKDLSAARTGRFLPDPNEELFEYLFLGLSMVVGIRIAVEYHRLLSHDRNSALEGFINSMIVWAEDLNRDLEHKGFSLTEKRRKFWRFWKVYKKHYEQFWNSPTGVKLHSITVSINIKAYDIGLFTSVRRYPFVRFPLNYTQITANVDGDLITFMCRTYLWEKMNSLPLH